MIWTETIPDTIIPGGTKRGEVRIDGYFWEIYASEEWGDDSGQSAGVRSREGTDFTRPEADDPIFGVQKNGGE